MTLMKKLHYYCLLCSFSPLERVLVRTRRHPETLKTGTAGQSRAARYPFGDFERLV